MADRDGVSTHVGLGSHNLDAEYVCADCGMVDEASRGAELLALRGRVAELEAAQREPIGYSVVLLPHPDCTNPHLRPSHAWRPVYTSPAEARTSGDQYAQMLHCELPALARQCRYVVVELREVADRG